jgi:hypothetical protein
MKTSSRIALVGLVTVSAAVAIAQTGRDNKKPTTPTPPSHASNDKGQAMPELPPPPPGWTQEEWVACHTACMEAGTPGENHAFLNKGVGTWKGTTKMWMAPGTEPSNGECTTVVTSILGGRYTKAEITSTCDMMPGMVFNGVGTYGFDNTTDTFQTTWMDNMSTATMCGTGELSSDKKTMTWVYNFTCPYTKKPMTMREVEHFVSDNEVKIEFFMPDVKTGKEFKMMEIISTRKPGVTAAGRER